MKKTILLFLGLSLSASLMSADFETANEAVKNMGVGWNLGNTLDANSQTITDITNVGYWGQQDLSSETCWGQPYTKPELLKMMKEAGFGAIRVPVTWYNHMDKDGKVDAAWMKRVHEVVDYVINQGMYCIVNVHHDTGADSYDNSGKLTGYHWIKANEENFEANQTRYEYLWTQIAEEFKDYGQLLLFESYNEMLDKLNSWCFASFNSSSKYDAAVATSAYNAINKYAQSFVNTVRATGGNNAQRNLVVNTYAACCGSGTWNDHLKDPLSQLTIPDDPSDATKSRLIVQVHDYPNIEGGIANVKKEIDDMVAAWNTNIISKGIPMILGEWGSSNVDKGDGKTDYDVRKDVLFEFVDYMVQKCKENNVATFYWMGLTDGANRSLPAFHQADLAERIVKAYHGSSFEGKFPTPDDFEIEYVVNYTQDWAELFLYGDWTDNNSIKVSDYKGIRVEMDKAYGSKLNVKVYGDKSGNGYKEQYVSLSDNSSSTTVTFDAASLGSTIQRITLQTSAGAQSARVKSATLIKADGTEVSGTITVAWGCTLTAEATPNTSEINTTIYHQDSQDEAIYNLQGQRVSKPSKGIYIKGGKKYIER